MAKKKQKPEFYEFKAKIRTTRQGKTAYEDRTFSVPDPEPNTNFLQVTKKILALLEMKEIVDGERKNSKASTSLKMQMVMVYFILTNMLWYYDDECYPTQKTLADKTGLTEKEVREATKRLEQLGFLVIEKREYKGHQKIYYKLPFEQEHRKRDK